MLAKKVASRCREESWNSMSLREQLLNALFLLCGCSSVGFKGNTEVTVLNKFKTSELSP